MSRRIPELSQSCQPKSPREERDLGHISHLRRASAWAAVVWFPIVLVLVSTGLAGWALGLAISGAAFSGLLRLAVAVSRCPRCEERYSSRPGGFRQIWQHDRCSGCGLARYAD
ncbi:MAG: hypothetical protein GY944_26285 [bacterium]|nr:hypothetical protein [bacterium]